jgi:hypothetical protein
MLNLKITMGATPESGRDKIFALSVRKYYEFYFDGDNYEIKGEKDIPFETQLKRYQIHLINSTNFLTTMELRASSELIHQADNHYTSLVQINHVDPPTTCFLFYDMYYIWLYGNIAFTGDMDNLRATPRVVRLGTNGGNCESALVFTDTYMIAKIGGYVQIFYLQDIFRKAMPYAGSVLLPMAEIEVYQ